MRPQYTADRSLPLPGDFDYRCKSLLILTTTTDNTAYANRVDLAGQAFGTDTCGKSWVRSSCATQYPRTDIFDLDDWVDFEFNDQLLTDPDSKSNAVLGVHNFSPLTYNFARDWIENFLPDNSSFPDKSRNVLFNQDYDLSNFGNLEVCSLTLNSGVVITVPDGQYVSSQSSVTVYLGANLDIQHGGNLIMVKDSYNGVSGPDLVQLNNVTVKVTKNTGGLDSKYDYVYWSTPLTGNTALNLPANSINNLFPASATFNANRFYGFRNANWFDGYDLGLANDRINPGVVDAVADNIDDNNDVWYLPTATQRNGLMTPGQGYITQPPQTPNPSPVSPQLNFDYKINFNGQANNGRIEVPVFRNSAVGTNSNIVGNPYPSSIDLKKFFINNSCKVSLHC